MKPDPIAWVYQNANTEHQYLVWHKQKGGRNWTPLFTLQDVQDAILAEREKLAAWMIKHSYATGHGDNIEDLLDELEWQVRQSERKINQELLEALKAYGSHTGNCDYLMLLLSMPPQRKPCSCGLHAAIAKHGSGA
jgi:hypothetical protein